jgi:hypothetical protein
MKQAQILACVWLGIALAPARAANVDWKLYGGVSEESGHESCFYEAKGVTSQPNAHIWVWTKCLPDSELERIDLRKENSKQILEATVRKTIEHYIPPIGTLEPMDKDQAFTVMEYEEAASVSNIKVAVANILRTQLSGTDGARAEHLHSVEWQDTFSKDKPTEWRHVPELHGAGHLKSCQMFGGCL